MNDASNIERRNFTRISFQSNVYLHSSDETWECQLVDISLKGILLNVPAHWNGQVGELFQLVLPLSKSEDIIDICMSINLAHCNDEMAGFAWEDIDMESFSHLRKVIEMNLGDVELVNREISALGKTQGKNRI